AFVLFKDGNYEYRNSFITDSGQKLVPYSANNNLIQNDVVLLPSEPGEYGSEEELVREVQTFIHRYVDVSPLFEKIASYYVLLSWVYDAFNELPYLRFRGDYGSGKTRALFIVGSLCYKPIFASGASTVSPLFRILDSFRGTLIIDEGDFRFSDERAEIIKILNNGNAKGFPVLRSEPSDRKGEFNPRAYHHDLTKDRQHQPDRVVRGGLEEATRFLAPPARLLPCASDTNFANRGSTPSFKPRQGEKCWTTRRLKWAAITC